jgi:hypothetical protein
LDLYCFGGASVGQKSPIGRQHVPHSRRVFKLSETVARRTSWDVSGDALISRVVPCVLSLALYFSTRQGHHFINKRKKTSTQPA